jgi:hypothetical protein
MKQILCAFMFFYTTISLAEIHPLIFKEDTETYSQVSFGMDYEEFKQKFKASIIECKEKTNAPLADDVCKVGFKLAGVNGGQAYLMFKNKKLLTVAGKFNSDYFDVINNVFINTFNDAAQTEIKDEKKNFFAKVHSTQYSVWSYPNYAMQITKFDTKNYEENGTNFGYAMESVGENIEVMRNDALKSSKFTYINRQPNVDLENLHLGSAIKVNNSQIAQTTPIVNTLSQPMTNTSVTTSYDNYKKETKYTGRKVENKETFTFIRAWKSDNNPLLTFQIYIDIMYPGDWRFYNAAYDLDGNRLDLVKINQKVSNCGRYGCTHNEHIGLNINKEYLLAHKLTGINLKLTSKSGKETTVFVGGNDISDMLNATQN